MRMNEPLKNLTLVAFDIETSGTLALDADICEVAAVKWQGGKIIDTFQSLVKPREKMSDFVIGIHGITNEMVADAPLVKDIMPGFHKFTDGCVMVAHHAPFDLGFIAYEYEKLGLKFSNIPCLCSSLLSRKLFPQSQNHKLQTLIEFFGIEKGAAHRALDDSKACLEVTLKCFEKFGMEKSFEEILKYQEVRLDWPRFSIFQLQETSVGNAVVSAIQRKKNLEFSYRSPNDKREIRPIGIVRNPGGDYLVAQEGADPAQKRFYFNRIVEARIIDA